MKERRKRLTLRKVVNESTRRSVRISEVGEHHKSGAGWEEKQERKKRSAGHQLKGCLWVLGRREKESPETVLHLG